MAYVPGNNSKRFPVRASRPSGGAEQPRVAEQPSGETQVHLNLEVTVSTGGVVRVASSAGPTATERVVTTSEPRNGVTSSSTTASGTARETGSSSVLAAYEAIAALRAQMAQPADGSSVEGPARPTAPGAKLPGRQRTRETEERILGTHTPVADIMRQGIVDRALVPHVAAMGAINDEALSTNPDLHRSGRAHEVLWFGGTRAYFVGYQVDAEKLRRSDRLTVSSVGVPDGVYVVPGLVKDTEDTLAFVRVPYATATGKDQQVGERSYSDLLPGAVPVFGHVDLTGRGQWNGPEFVPADTNWYAHLLEVQAIAGAVPAPRLA